MNFARLIALIAAAHVMGGHWLVLQIVAWSGMMVSFTQQDGLAEAVGKTFDGSSPCCLCEMVKQGQEEEQEHSIIESSHKLNAVLMSPAVLPLRSSTTFTFVPSNKTLFSAPSQEPVPPPPRVA